MQPTTQEMQSPLTGIALQDLHHDDFLDHMLSVPWTPDLGSPKSPWQSTLAGAGAAPFDESSLLASRLRQHQIGAGARSPTAGRPPMLQLSHGHRQQQMLLSAMAAGRSPTSAGVGGADSPLKSPSAAGGNGIYNGYNPQSMPNQQHFNCAQGGGMGTQNYGGIAASGGVGQTPATSVSTASASAGSGAAPPRQRVRARRGQATDPHSIAERLRRERIAERMKGLQELVPNANKTDKASMLDEIIDYVKFLQLQVKVLSMSRLGGAAGGSSLVSDISTEGRSGANGAAGTDSLSVSEHQVAKLMEEDMGSAMQYLQGKGLCLMPISLASAISTTTCRPSSSLNPGLVPLPNYNSNAAVGAGDASPTSTNMSVLTAQSTVAEVSRLSGGKESPVGGNQ